MQPLMYMYIGNMIDENDCQINYAPLIHVILLSYFNQTKTLVSMLAGGGTSLSVQNYLEIMTTK